MIGYAQVNTTLPSTVLLDGSSNLDGRDGHKHSTVTTHCVQFRKRSTEFANLPKIRTCLNCLFKTYIFGRGSVPLCERRVEKWELACVVRHLRDRVNYWLG